MLGSVQRDQRSPAQALERRQRPGSLDRFEEQRVECRRGGAVQHQADVVVGGDRRHAEQRLAVRSAVAFLQRPLMRQERRASHEEDRERRQADVGHCIVAVTRRSLAPVRDTGTDLAQLLDQLRYGAHPALESTIESGAQAKTTLCCGMSFRNSSTCCKSELGHRSGSDRAQLNRIENRWLEPRGLGRIFWRNDPARGPPVAQLGEFDRGSASRSCSLRRSLYKQTKGLKTVVCKGGQVSGAIA